MPIRKCENCKKEFTKKSTYDYHIKRKKKCDFVEEIVVDPEEAEIAPTNSAFTQNYSSDDLQEDDPPIVVLKDSKKAEKNKKEHRCGKCKKSFARIYNLNRHIANKSCYTEQDKPILDRLLKEFAEFKKANEKLAKENKELKNEIKKITIQNGQNVSIVSNNKNSNIVNANNHHNTNSNNIIVVNYGKEDMGKIDEADILRCMRMGFQSATQMTELTHFNQKYPENHNIYISSLKDKYAMIYRDGGWQTVIEKEAIHQLYNSKRDYIEDNMEGFFDQLLDSQKKSLRRWLDTDDCSEQIKNIKNNIRLVLYNKRRIPIETHRKMLPLTE